MHRQTSQTTRNTRAALHSTVSVTPIPKIVVGTTAAILRCSALDDGTSIVANFAGSFSSMVEAVISIFLVLIAKISELALILPGLADGEWQTGYSSPRLPVRHA